MGDIGAEKLKNNGTTTPKSFPDSSARLRI